MIDGAYRVVVSPRALADLREIRAYIAVDSPATADRMLDRLRQTMQGLEILPFRFTEA